MEIDSSPLIIDFDSGRIFGVLRGAERFKKLVIMCPAATGTRIGPQRIYVEIAQKLLENNYASYCLDLPPLGDSYDQNLIRYKGAYSARLAQHYANYLDILFKHFKNNYAFTEYVLLSISDGCLPIYNYAKRNSAIKKIILLSPNHLLDSVQTVNTKNLRRYYRKLFQKETWIKLFSFNLNVKKIISNIYQKPIKENIQIKKKEIGSIVEHTLSIFGENEMNLKECLDYWEGEKHKNIKNYSYNVIRGADHSYFGWQFKKDVECCIAKWLS